MLTDELGTPYGHYLSPPALSDDIDSLFELSLAASLNLCWQPRKIQFQLLKVPSV